MYIFQITSLQFGLRSLFHNCLPLINVIHSLVSEGVIIKNCLIINYLANTIDVVFPDLNYVSSSQWTKIEPSPLKLNHFLKSVSV